MQGRSEKRRYWYCLCDCGNTIQTTDTRLKTDHTKSCGCIRQTTSDLKVGLKVGDLILRAKLPHKSGNRNGAYWLCVCSCGKEIQRSTNQLRTNTNHNCRSGLHRHGFRVYPATPKPYPEGAIRIFKKYSHLASTLNQGMAEDIANAAILRGAWICYWRETQGFPVEFESAYFAKIIRMALIQETRRTTSEYYGNSVRITEDIKIGGSVTDLTCIEYPVAEAETPGNMILSSGRKKFKRC